MSPVATIIKRHILGGRDVNLPSFGTLEVVKYGAEYIDNAHRLTAPRKELVISDRQTTETIIDYISEECGIEHHQSVLLYNNWIDNSLTDDRFIIDGVCTISLEEYRVDINEEFRMLLNPMDGDKLVVNRIDHSPNFLPLRPARKRGSVILYVALIVVMVALAYLGYYFRESLNNIIQ